MSVQISVMLPCKPYVRVFIEQNYGKPTRFYKDKGVMTIIRLMLQRQDNRLEYRPINKEVYTDTVSFQINESDFNHYGAELSNQAVMDLNNYFEGKVKYFMHSWCAAQFTYGMGIQESIKAFQEMCGFPEEIWKFDSMYKDCLRNGVFTRIPKNDLHQTIHQIILSQMSKNRTITNKGKLVYEEN